MKRTISLQQRLIFFILTILLVMGVILFLVIRPTIGSIEDLTTRVDQTESFIDERYDQARNMQRSLREIDTVAEEVALYQSFTVPADDELALITRFEELATAVGVEQRLDIRTSDVPARPNGQRIAPDEQIELSIITQGTYEQQLAYLQALEELPFYVLISAMQWDRRGELQGTTTTISTLRFIATVYATR